MKNKHFFFCSIIAIAMLLAGCGNNPDNETDRSSNSNGSGETDSKRSVSSPNAKGSSADIPVFMSIEEMEESSQLIVTGKRIGAPEDLQGNNMTNTIFTIQVEQVIKGPENLNTIKFFQLREHSSDEYETKLKEDTTYLLFLTENYTRDTETGPEILYNSISFEQGIFEIDDSGLLKAYSRIGIAPQLEKKEFTLFEQELQKAIQQHP